MTLKIHLLVLSCYLSISSAFSFVLHGTKTAERKCGEEIVLMTPFEESEKRGTYEPYAQGVGCLSYLLDSTTKVNNTATLIAPDLVLTSGHSVDLDFLNYTAFEIQIEGTPFTSKVETAYICPGYYPSTPHSLNKQKDPAKDLAIVKLTKELPLNEFISFYDNSHTSLFKNKIHLDCIGISAGYLVASDQPKKTKKCRHISEAKVFFEDDINSFKETFHVSPPPRPSSLQHNGATPYHPEAFDYTYPHCQFLKGGFNPGDSGSPLIVAIDNTYKIVGVASQRLTCEIPDARLSQIIPKKFSNIWAPTIYNISWIKEILDLENALPYHPELMEA